MIVEMRYCVACGREHYQGECPVNDIERLEGYRGDTEASTENALNTPFARAVAEGRIKPVDDIAHPQHYARWKMEPIEFIAINDLPWWLANVIKYTMRFDAKDGLKDLYKARSYLDMKIRQIEGAERFWDKPVAEERKLNVGR